MLHELVGEIERLRTLINERHSVSRHNEAATRQYFIEPLLRVLGWDTADPTLVMPEHNSPGGRADYVLFGRDQKPVAIVEAKALGTKLADKSSQPRGYARDREARFFALSDGNIWEIYAVSQPMRGKQYPVLNVSITGTDSVECALQFLLLWRPNLTSGQPMAMQPIQSAELGPTPTTNKPPVKSAPVQTPVQNKPGPQSRGWPRLSELPLKGGTRRPKNVQLPSGAIKAVKSWTEVLIVVAEWLVRDGTLKGPIQAEGAQSTYLVNSRPRHSTRAFRRYHDLPKNLYLDTDAGSVVIIRRSKQLLKKCGKDPASVHVQVG